MIDEKKERHLEGRWPIEGRRLRYEAGTDIGFVVLQILKEFAADCESEFFVCVQDKNLERVRPLIERGERLACDDNPEVDDLEGWKVWLHDVAEIVPYLWD